MYKILFLMLILSQYSYAKIIIASGGVSGHYHTLAFEQCKTIKNCEVLQTSGSLENISLLRQHRVDYAIIQSNLLTKDLRIVKHLGTEEFYIFYKNLPRKPTSLFDLMDMVDTEYSFDVKSGTFATFKKIMSTFNIEVVGKPNDIQNKKQTFCERDTKLSIYVVSKNSLAFRQLLLCGKFYTFNKIEIEALADKFDIVGGLAVNDILLVGH